MDMAVMQKIVDSLSVKELLAVKEKIEERLVRNIDFKGSLWNKSLSRDLPKG